MVLEKCPHMTARCAHYRAECDDPASKDCHYIKRTTASMITTAASLHALGVEKLSPAMRRYLQQTETFLMGMGTSLLKE